MGHGRVGGRIAAALAAQRVPFVVAEENREIVEQLRARDIPAVSGDASEAAVLIQAHIARAGMLVIATPDTFAARKMAETARTLKPGIEVVLRSHSEADAALMSRERVGEIFLGDEQLALGMARHVVQRMKGRVSGATEVPPPRHPS